ncbi:MAG TPA: hypothetical protein VGF79_14135 [Bacteroidia bacterium]
MTGTLEQAYEIFKTNIDSKTKADHVIQVLNQLYPGIEINFDLEDCDKILRIKYFDVLGDSISETLSQLNYQCVELN